MIASTGREVIVIANDITVKARPPSHRTQLPQNRNLRLILPFSSQLRHVIQFYTDLNVRDEVRTEAFDVLLAQAGSFGPDEDTFFDLVSKVARAEGIPRVYVRPSSMAMRVCTSCPPPLYGHARMRLYYDYQSSVTVDIV